MDIKNALAILLTALLCCLPVTKSRGQNSFGSEEELIRQAKKYFEEEDYAQAFPLYSQLLSLYPQDADYNYRFGVCQLIATSEKEKSISYLLKSAQNEKTDPAVYYFLGKAYHLNYRFDEAIQSYNTFKRKANRSQAEKYKPDREIYACYNGKQLLRNLTDLVVMDKKEIAESEYFRAYDLSSIGGKLLVKIDDLKSSFDKKKNEKSIIYLARNNESIFYSSYGKDGKTGKDIFFVRKQPGGEWSTPQSLGTPINTVDDEDYPFLHPNGKILYFCSKGHNSMGGYDVFKTVYDSLSGNWGQPKNLDFPVNSPDDDILFVTDSLENTAYFSSSRSTPAGIISVYKINTERKPSDIVIIQGNFALTGKRGKIAVKNAQSGETLDIIQCDPATGEYTLSLANGGKFVFTVEFEGQSTQSDAVVLPFQTQMRPVKQGISYDATGKLVIKNSFDESGDDVNYQVALNYIKEKARMDINFNAITPAEEVPEKDIIPVENSAPASFTNKELVKMAYEDATETESDYKKLKAEADYALVLASEKNEQALRKSREAKQVLENAENIQDPVSQQAEIERGTQLSQEAELLERNTIAAYNIAKKLEADANYKKQEADLSQQYARDLDAAVNSTDPNAAVTKLAEQKLKLESIPRKEAGTGDIYNNLKTDADLKQREADQAVSRSAELKNEIQNLEKESANTQREAEETKNENLRDALNRQASELENDLVISKKELEENNKKVARLQKEAAAMKDGVSMAGEMMDRMKTDAVPADEVAAIDRGKLDQQVSAYEVGEDPSAIAGPPGSSLPESQTENIYSDKLAEAEKIPDPVQREEEKARIYKEWGDAAEKDIQQKRQDFAGEEDEQKKSELVREMTELEELQKEKSSLAETSAANAEEMKSVAGNTQDTVIRKDNPGVQPVRTATVTDPVTEPAYNDVFLQRLQFVSSIPDEADREQAKSLVYKSWNDSLSNEIERTKAQRDAVSDPGQKEKIEQRVAILESKLAENKRMETESQATADRLSQQPVASPFPNTPESGQPVATDSLPLQQDTQPPVTASQSLDYTSPSASAAISRSESQQRDAEQFNIQAEDFRRQASLASTPEQKRNLLLKAGEAEQKAREKQLESEYSLAEANQAEFSESNKMLTDISARTAEKDASDIIVAQLRQDEAEQYFRLAAAEREAARSETSYELKSQRLSKAREFENVALDKQKKATETYRKYNPDYVYTPSPAKQGLAANNTMPGEETGKIKVPDQPLDTLSSSPADRKTESPLSEEKAGKQQIAPQDSPAITGEAKKQEQRRDTSLSSPGVTTIAAEEYPKVESAALREKADEQVKASQDLLNSLDTITNEERKEHALRQIREYDRQAQENYQKSDSIEKTASGPSPLAKAESFPLTVPAAEKKAASGEPVPKPFNRAPGNLPGRSRPGVPDLASGEFFETGSRSVYSRSNPIPVDPELPEGVIFKVQIGAFRNPIPQNLFSGISPITAETTPQGLMRYTAGIFKKIQSATAIRDYIRGIGYPDAFIVAFLDGKRVPVGQAAQLTGEPAEKFVKVGGFQVGANVTPGEASREKTILLKDSALAGSGEVTAGYLPASSEEVKNVGGLLFTVQIGVFARQVSSAELNNIQPLYSDVNENGQTRYHTGIYTDISKAALAKRIVVNLGIKDAFVVAYYNGKRVTLQEAKLIETSKGNGAFPSVPNVNVMPTGTASAIQSLQAGEAPVVSPVQPGDRVPVAQPSAAGELGIPHEPPQAFDDESVVYKIQVGAYEEYVYMYFKAGPFDTVATVLDTVTVNEKVPVELANKYINIRGMGLKSYKDENGRTIYTVGYYKTLREASRAKEQVVAGGVSDAFIVAYSKGKKITLKEARERTGE